jgi:hypothetical protein
MYTKDNIELRSEKVRKVIGKIPPFLIRIGTAIITLIMIAFALAFYTIPYPISLNVEGTVDKNMRLNINVPYKDLYLFQKPRIANVVYEGIENPPICYHVSSYSPKLVHYKGENWFIAKVRISNSIICGIRIRPQMKADVSIVVSDKTLWQQIFKSRD